jgi:hypothetical protein
MKQFESGKQVGKSVAGRAQGIAMALGKGRVAIFGEAAMFSAQVVGSGEKAFKVGMNAVGNDNRQLDFAICERDSTILLWGGEFGRTPCAQGRC